MIDENLRVVNTFGAYMAQGIQIAIMVLKTDKIAGDNVASIGNEDNNHGSKIWMPL